MFNPTKIIIDAFIEKLNEDYFQVYGMLEPEYPHIISFVARLALEKIANSDAPYHDLHHTILVTEVGQEILRGKHIHTGGVSPNDWLNFTISLLCHDIGYVRGICVQDKANEYQIDEQGNTTQIARGATDASLTPYHVDRSKLFIKQRFAHVNHINIESVQSYIEYTRFPVPDSDNYDKNGDYPGLLRAADLIGQMADVNYPKKIGLLFQEFVETGTAKILSYESAADLKDSYPGFYWQQVNPVIQEAVLFLRETQEGKQWLSNLYANVFAEEHHIKTFGSES